MLRVTNPLTTSEGWRRFADHQPQPPELLDDTTLQALWADERPSYVEACKDYQAAPSMVNTPVIQKVINTPRLLIRLNRYQVSAHRGVIISGASGTGNTCRHT